MRSDTPAAAGDTTPAAVIRHNQALRALNAIGTALSSLTDRDTTLRLIYERLGEVLDNRNFYIAVYQPADHSLFFPVYTIEGEMRPAGGRPYGSGLTEYVMESRQTLLVTERADETLAALGVKLYGSPSASLLAVPMVAGSEVLGVMAVQDYTREHAYGEHERELLETVASQAAVALRNVTLYEAVQQELAERRRAEEALRASESRYRAVTEVVSDYAYAYELDESGDTRLEWVTDAYSRITGYQPGEVEALALWQQVIVPEDLPVVEAHRAAIRAGAAHACEYRIITKQGELRWLYDACHPVWDAELERATHVYGAAQDITERRRAEDTAREADRRLRETLEHAQLLAVVVDREARITFCNDYLLAVTGWTRPELLGRNWFEVFATPERRPERLAEHLAVMASDTPRQYLEDELVTRWGERRLIAWTNVRLRAPDGQVLGASSLGQDITEDRLHKRELETMAALSTALRAASTRAEMLPVILEQVRGAAQAAGAALALRAPAAAGAVFELAVGVLAPLHGKMAPAAGPGWTAQALAGAATYTTVALAPKSDPALATLATGAPSREPLAAACLPLSAGQHTFGALWVARPAAFAAREVRVLEALAETAGNALHRATLHEQTQRRAEQLAAVSELGRTLAETLDLPQIYERLYAALGQLVPDIAWLTVALFDEEGQPARLVFAAQHGQPVPAETLPQSGIRVAAGEPQRQAIQSRRPTIADAAEAAGGQAPAGGRWGLILPMIAKGQVIGLVEVYSAAAGRFGADDAELLNLAVNSAAVTIENVRLFSETERRLRHMQALHDIDRAISSSLDVRVTLSVLLEQTTTQLDVDAAAVLLLDPHLQTLSFAAGRGFRQRAIERTHLRLGEGPPGRAALERKTIHLAELSEAGADDARHRALAAEGFVSHLAVPLMAKGEVKGVLDIFHRSVLRPNAEWWDFLHTLAAQAAIAIDNSALFDSLQRSNIELSLAYDATIEGWSRALDLRDKETEGHTQRVTQVTERLARAMGGFGEADLMHIRRGALLHDIGKMGIPDRILLKPGPLTDEEWVIMRQHPNYALELLSPIAYLRPALDIPIAHHERWDGDGYPRGLARERIPLPARIFAVVDVWDALRSDRPYRPAWPAAKVNQYLREQSGAHFDPRVIEVFLSIEHSLG